MYNYIEALLDTIFDIGYGEGVGRILWVGKSTIVWRDKGTVYDTFRVNSRFNGKLKEHEPKTRL